MKEGLQHEQKQQSQHSLDLQELMKEGTKKPLIVTGQIYGEAEYLQISCPLATEFIDQAT